MLIQNDSELIYCCYFTIFPRAKDSCDVTNCIFITRYLSSLTGNSVVSYLRTKFYFLYEAHIDFFMKFFSRHKNGKSNRGSLRAR